MGTIDRDTGAVAFIETDEFDDGYSDTLHWTIRKIDTGKYSGLENRLQGEAAGEQAGWAGDDPSFRICLPCASNVCDRN